MPRTRSRGGPGPRPVVLVFGESPNDAESVEHLLVAANPDLEGRVRATPKPASLVRDAGRPAVRDWVARLDNVVTATEATGVRVVAVVVHRDADFPDPRGEAAAELERQLARIGGKPVVPVQTIEAWWLLFPDAVEAVRPQAWRGKLSRKPRDVEAIDRPKQELQRATRTKRCEYSEGDSPVIAEHIRRHALQPLNPCPSYARMQSVAREVWR